jgi:DNA-binding transcriptional regulator YbjK
MATTRERALDAAVHLVGEQGVRALTHARVDAAAGLPKGSTSNWFRTRDALVEGVLVWIAEQERADLDAAFDTVRSADDVVEALTRMLEDATGRHAHRTRARYALFLETTATPEAQPAMRAQRSLFEDWTRERFAALGAADPDVAARTVLATSAGIIMNRLTVAPEAPIRPTVELVVRAALGSS